MKKMFLIIALVVTGLTVKAQETQQDTMSGSEDHQYEQTTSGAEVQQPEQQTPGGIPQSVSSSFSEKFSDVNIQDVEWETEAGFHIAEFAKEDKEYEALFDANGKWVSTEVAKIPKNEIPKEVQSGLQETGYSNWSINEVEKIESKDLTLYKLEVRKGLKGSDIYMDDSGSIVRVDS